MSWPEDADGDVFRRLEVHGFDFSQSHAVEYNVEFQSWPPAPSALELLREQFGDIEVYEPKNEGYGYVLFTIKDRVSYESVTSTQRSVNSAMAPFGGKCDSWGVLH